MNTKRIEDIVNREAQLEWERQFPYGDFYKIWLELSDKISKEFANEY